MRVNKAIEDGSLLREPGAAGCAFERGRNVHLLGLVSYGGVHSHIDHLRALLALRAPEKTWIHAFTDGRDVSPHAAVHDLAELPRTGSRRSPAATTRWTATSAGNAPSARSTRSSVRSPVTGTAPSRTCSSSTTPASRTSSSSPSTSRAGPGSSPATRRSSSTSGPTGRGSSHRSSSSAGFDLTTMTRYRDDLDCPVVFEEQEVPNTLAEVLAANGARQLHCAETEKYAHVTYFFNGGREEEWPGETRILVPVARARSATYDQKPEMSAPEVAARFAAEIGDGYRLRDRQLREPRHGRPHRVDSGHDRRRRGGRPLPGRGRRRRSSAPAASRWSPPTTGTPRRCSSRGRRQPAHGAHDEPGAARRHPPGRYVSATAGSSPTSPRRASICSASSSRRR